MKSKPQSKRDLSHERLSRRTASVPRWALLVCLLTSLMCACQSRTTDKQVEWVDVAEATAPGRLVVLNHSDQALTRLWFSPSDIDGLWPGAEPDTFEQLMPGNVFEDTIPAGWWDVWFEASDGADVLLYRTWFGDDEETIFEIRESWWELGDWIEQSNEAETSSVRE